MKNITASKKSPHPFAKSDRLTTAIICVLLAATVWLAFGQTIHHEFVNYDDGDYIYENSHVAAGLTLQGIGWAFTHFHAANWHPLTTISHMLDCQIYGLQPWGHHLTNVLLHALAAILLFLALKTLTTPSGSHLASINYQPSTSALWASVFVAALFAVHPLRVESVAWVSERKDVLSGLFFMLTLLAYASYARSCSRGALSPRFETTPRQSGAATTTRYLSVVILFALALMCKPTVVSLPFVLLLLDYWPLGRWRGTGSPEPGVKSEAKGKSVLTSRQFNASTSDRWSAARSLIIEKLPLFVLSAVSCVITILAQRQALEPALNANLLQRINNAVVSYVIYLRQFIYPFDLTVSYPYAPIRIGESLFAIALLTTISAVFLLVRKRYPFLVIGWLWYLGVLVPMIGLVQVGLQPRADRYTYLPHIGLYLLLGFGIAATARKLNLARLVVPVAALITIGVFVAITRTQITYWQNSESLWRHAIQSAPGNYMAYNDLGTQLLHQHQPEAAVLELQKAIQIKPDFENAYVSAGSAFMLMNRIDEAANYYRKALQLHPDSAEDWSNLATVFLKQNKIDEAIVDYGKAAALKPQSAEMQYNLGHALANNKQWDDAITCYRAAIRLAPGEAKFHNNLAVAFVETRQYDPALEELNQALKANPNYPDAQYNLGCLLAQLGRKQEAIEHLNQVLRLDPNYTQARQQLLALGELSPN